MDALGAPTFPKSTKQPAIVRVGGGRGFMMECSAVHGCTGRIVITAAHCLPHLPPAHPAASASDKTYATILGPLNGGEPSIWCECLFVDPVADVAVLCEPDVGAGLVEEYEAFERFCEETDTLTLGALPDRAQVHAWVLSRDGRWLQCMANVRKAGMWLTDVVGQIEGGMSGSPIVTTEGAVIGLLGTSTNIDGVQANQHGPMVRLPHQLPHWLGSALRAPRGMNQKPIESLTLTQRKHLATWISNTLVDTADGDYIAARASYRAGLHLQASWSSAQAIEKYFKAILLYSGRSVKSHVRHDLMKLLDEVASLPIIGFHVPEDCRDWLERLDSDGANRYFDVPVVYDVRDVHRVDRLVWHIRRYCWDFMLMPGDDEHFPGERAKRLNTIPGDRSIATLSTFAIKGGYLEEVLDGNVNREQRRALTWNNRFYTLRARKHVRVKGHTGFRKPLHVMRPEILLDLLERLVPLPRPVREELRQQKAAREKELAQ